MTHHHSMCCWFWWSRFDRCTCMSRTNSNKRCLDIRLSHIRLHLKRKKKNDIKTIPFNTTLLPNKIFLEYKKKVAGTNSFNFQQKVATSDKKLRLPQKSCDFRQKVVTSDKTFREQQNVATSDRKLWFPTKSCDFRQKVATSDKRLQLPTESCVT